MRPTASTGTFNCVSSTERQTSPAPETPGAPIDKIIIELLKKQGVEIPKDLIAD